VQITVIQINPFLNSGFMASKSYRRISLYDTQPRKELPYKQQWTNDWKSITLEIGLDRRN
jgi:hypothetical protein